MSDILEPSVNDHKKHKKSSSKKDKSSRHDGMEGEPILDTPTVSNEVGKWNENKEKRTRGNAVERGSGHSNTEVFDDSTEKKKKKKRKNEALVDLEDEKEVAVKNVKKVCVRETDVSDTAQKGGKRKRKFVSDESVMHDTASGVSTTKLSIHSESEISSYLSEHAITINYGSSAQPGGSVSTVPNSLKPILSFHELSSRIHPSLQSALSSFKNPTPIQACSWPAILEGRDVVGIAETGSGKTLAFGIPAVSNIVKSRHGNASNNSFSSVKTNKKSKSRYGVEARISVLALAPTRELALQTHVTFSSLGSPFGLTSVAIFGGVDKEPQRRALLEVGAAMVVGTPGRILDLLNEGACDLSGVTYLVLDEADRMLDKGFENDIRAIISHTALPEQRQTLMFSATWPDAVRKLASTFQHDPIRVTVGSDDLTANRRVAQVVEVFEDRREKDFRLSSHLRTLKARKGGKQLADESRILVFVLYKKEASRVEQYLQRQGFSVGGIHGDLSQSARTAALDDFRSGKTQLLVATDVAARGLDIPNVGTVINYSFPLTVEDYVHRIGRTGRGGHSGKSITFFTGDDHERALAGELAKVLRESGADADPLKIFPMTIKKKTHSVYGAFFRTDVPSDALPTRMKF
ncbi:hypothetical protein EW145_g170 [Phellinidium pouzarii]|uniref:RNA helicase n=1 Tax=Phellinidium pouzarii TaxID=167371 RepID=A0A4S4LL98_9AGAM|nr:hypothetical protein EW145_g170 [Phellinidium pouzarii]